MNTEAFLEVIDRTPLVSIDLILTNGSGEVLLGQRVNRPAQGYWFVPGGRIRKEETLRQAMARISTVELGFAARIEDAQLLGAYDHIYDDNFAGREAIHTHYVALGYQLPLGQDSPLAFDAQHSEMKWWSIEELLQSNEVHTNTKAYFRRD